MTDGYSVDLDALRKAASGITVEYRGAVFLRDRFGQDNIDNWFTTLDGDGERIEAVADHVELWALFGNTPLTADDHLGEEPRRRRVSPFSTEEDGAYGPTVTFWTTPAASVFG